MSARPSGGPPPARLDTPRPRDMSQLRSRRRRAARRRRLARIDLGLGVLGALVLLILAPGLALVALIALVVLVLCGLSLVVQRRRSRRG